MAVMDEFKEEREQMKQAPFKKKWEYFWDYHKTHVIVGIAALFLLGTFIHDRLTQQETVFMAAFVDCASNSTLTDAYTQELMNAMEIDTSTETIVLDTRFNLSESDGSDVSAIEVLMVRIAAAELDSLLASEETFGRYTASEIYADLREVLTPQQLAYYEDSFYYVDNAVITAASLDPDDLEYTDDTDHTTPDGMEEPVPVGIYLNTTEDFQSTYYFSAKEPVVFGIISNAPHPERAGQFLDYISGSVE